MEAEHYMGNLWITRGEMPESLSSSGHPVVILPGHIQREVHPITDRFASVYPEVRQAVESSDPKRYSLGDITDCGVRWVELGNIRFAIVYATYHTQAGDIPCPDCPPERWWAKIIKERGRKQWATEFHWQEFYDTNSIDIPGLINRMFWGMMNGRKPKFYYYNPQWDVVATRRVTWES